MQLTLHIGIFIKILIYGTCDLRLHLQTAMSITVRHEGICNQNHEVFKCLTKINV